MSTPTQDNADEANQRALRYCTTCPRMCRFACPVAHTEARETVTPWGLMSMLRLQELGVVAFDAHVTEALSRCTGCLRCQSACLHDNHLPRVIFDGRRRARDAGFPSDAPTRTGQGVERDGEALGFRAQATTGFFSDSNDLDEVRRVAELLDVFSLPTQLGAGGGEATSGYELIAAGLRDAYLQHVDALARQLSGFDRLLTDSETLLALLSTDGWRDPWAEHGLTRENVLHWSEALSESLTGSAPTRPAPSALRLTYHDSCKLGRGAGVFDPPRGLLRWAFGEAALIEMEDHREASLCCGGGAGYPQSAPEHADTMARGFSNDAARVGATHLVTAGTGCRRHLSRATDGVMLWSLSEALLGAIGPSSEV